MGADLPDRHFDPASLARPVLVSRGTDSDWPDLANRKAYTETLGRGQYSWHTSQYLRQQQPAECRSNRGHGHAAGNSSALERKTPNKPRTAAIGQPARRFNRYRSEEH